MSDFEPPKYVSSLIAAINDGAKSAQAGALIFLALGVYLLAVAISTTDEDLLLAHTTNLAQLGVQVAPAVSLGIAPLVFVAVHVFTLVRYDLLGANLRHLRETLGSMVPLEADREHCRQLLANVKFVVALTAPPGSPLRSPLFGWVARGVIAVFPVAVLLAVQISALRYQNSSIIFVQRIALLADLVMLVWFFRRAGSGPSMIPGTIWRRLWLWTRLLWAPVLVVLAAGYWLKIPGPDAAVVRFEAGQDHPKWWQAWPQPLDLWFCPVVGWGCRFLVVDNRTLIARVWKPEAIAEFRNGTCDKPTLAAVEGAFLRYRTLRNAALDQSALYGADLIGADLRHADLHVASLCGAKLFRANLTSADLGLADLTGAKLTFANLRGALLLGASLIKADLTGADLTRAKLSRADLSGANLTSASLSEAKLNGADLTDADLTSAKLSGADLSGANLTSAKLNDAYLSGANLSGANLTYVDLRTTVLTSARYDGRTQLPSGFNPGAARMIRVPERAP
jgi:uncharacterized protein YjbI with pentapeptide repeats